MKSEHLFAAVLATCALFGASCSSTSTPGTASGGAPGQAGQTGQAGQVGGSSGGAGNASGSCTAAANVVPCGGSVVGSWTVTPSCLTVSGVRDTSATGLGCATVKVSGSVQVSGSWSANADGTYTDHTVATGQETIDLAASCLLVSGTTTDCSRVSGFVQAMGYEKVTCSPATAGGCSCAGTVNHMGGVGLLSADSPSSGNYTVANNAITTGQDALSQQPIAFSYCAANGKMNWSPKSTAPTYTGSIAFQSGGSVGTGGSGGMGGSGGSAGGSGGSTTGGTGGTAGSGGSAGGTSMTGTAPCDIYEGAKTPCVGAFSSVRALYKAYNGPLYQVRSKADKTSVKDIPLLEAGGFANSKVQDDFCTGGCTISKIYDQSPKKNDLALTYAVHWLVLSPPTGQGQAVATESNATDAKITVGGHTVYGIKSSNGVGAYRVNAKGAAMGDAAEAIYEVADATVTGPACCDDFGNVSTTGLADGEGTMETIFYSKFTGFGHGAGSGPWLMADLEFGVYPSNMANDNSIPSLSIPKFATLMLNGFSGNRYALKAGDAQMGALKTTWDGTRPPKYSPMKKGGAFVLGTGGDGSFLGAGVFFEGAITLGCPDDKAIDDAIQASVVAAGYGK